jgi:hypothetical protein
MRQLIVCLFLIPITILLYPGDLKISIIDRELELPLEGVRIVSESLTEVYFTDSEGRAVIEVDEDTERIVLIFSLPGYEVKKVLIKDFEGEQVFNMVIEGIIEGEELVVEEKYYEEEKLGTSYSIEKAELISMANKGMYEDVMNMIKLLPGVTVADSDGAEISVRGGYFNELAANLNGFLLRYPLILGEKFTIFNPNTIDTVKFYNGIFGVENGFALSGFFDVYMHTPDEGFKFKVNLSTSTLDFYLETPLFFKNSGLLLSGRATYLELTLKPIWEANDIYVKRCPYIYDSNLYWYWQPRDTFTWSVTGFIVADGIGMGDTTTTDFNDEEYEHLGIDGKITEEDYFFAKGLHTLGMTSFKILPGDRLFINYMLGYEYLSITYEGEETDTGEKDYSQDFIDLYNPPDSSFTVDIHEEDKETSKTHSIQTRLDIDFAVNDKFICSFGAGFLYDLLKMKEESSEFELEYMDYVTTEISHDDFHEFNSYPYINFHFFPVHDRLEIELGCRMDHFFAISDNDLINTPPVPGPRLYVSFTPVRDHSHLEYFTLSIGSGLYCKMPYYRDETDIDGNIPDKNLKQMKCVNNVLGFELLFPAGYLIKVEGFYKYYFHRFYSNSFIDTANNDREYYITHSDGIGHTGGFEIFLKKSISRYFDCAVSYSFVYAKYKNPQTDGVQDTGSTPKGRWFFPDFHLFHNLKLLFNIRPRPWCTITLSGGISSGVPRYLLSGEPEMTSVNQNGQQMELYYVRRYLSEERTKMSFPFNIKITFNNYFKNSKIKWEIYIALDNISALFYDLEPRERFNEYTGEVEDGGSGPYDSFMPSVGINISY